MRDATLDEILCRTVLLRLKKHNWNRTYASESLGVSVRTIRNYIHTLMAEYQVDVPPENKKKTQIRIHDFDISPTCVKDLRSICEEDAAREV